MPRSRLRFEVILFAIFLKSVLENGGLNLAYPSPVRFELKTGPACSPKIAELVLVGFALSSGKLTRLVSTWVCA